MIGFVRDIADTHYREYYVEGEQHIIAFHLRACCTGIKTGIALLPRPSLKFLGLLAIPVAAAGLAPLVFDLFSAVCYVVSVAVVLVTSAEHIKL